MTYDQFVELANMPSVLVIIFCITCTITWVLLERFHQ
jgi:hypothetical protein